jgi:hypothetical protein
VSKKEKKNKGNKKLLSQKKTEKDITGQLGK